MYYKIYPDVIFLTNLLTDYVLLSIWAKLCRITTTYARLVFASAAGAAWSVAAAVFKDMPVVPEVFCTYFAVVLLMVYIAGLRGNRKKICTGLLAFYAVAVFAGGVFGLLSRNHVNSLMLAAACVLLYQGSALAAGLIKKYVTRKNLLYGVKLEMHGKTVCTKGLFDTGNSLTDPYNGKPVCVAEKAVFEKIKRDDGVGTDKGVRLIPFYSLGKKNGLMRLVTIDSMTVECGGRKKRYERPEFAIYEGSLSPSGEYGVILNVHGLEDFGGAEKQGK